MAVNNLRYNSHGKKYAVARKRVYSIFELQSGDHIAFHRFRGLYWHHAIVEYIDVENGEIGVIHYSNTPGGFIQDNSSSPKRGGKGRVVREKYEFEKVTVYLMMHERCLDPDTVVFRAQMKVGDDKYNAFTNNCEHFAMECKTGVSSSDQVNKAKEMLIDEIGSNATSVGAARGFTETTSRAGKEFLPRGVRLGANAGQKFISRGAVTNGALIRGTSRIGQEFLQRGSTAGMAFTRGGVRMATNQALTRTAYASQTSTAAGIGSLAGGVVIGTAIESISMSYDIGCARADMEAGRISRSEFEEAAGRRLITGSMSIGGSATGMVIGQALIPVPILGAFVGATVGGLFGSVFGNALANM